MQIRSFIKRGVILALISVLLNIYLIYRLDQLESKLSQQINQASANVNYAQMQANNVAALLEKLQEEQKWLAQADFTPQTVTPEGVILKGTFDFRRLAPGAEIVLQFRPIDGNTWKEAVARRVSDLTYEAEFTVSTDKEYEYRLLARGQNGQQASEITSLPARVHRRPLLLPAVGYASSNGKVIKVTITLNPAFTTLVPGFRPIAATLKALEADKVKFFQDFAPGEHPEKQPFVLEGVSLPPGTDLYLSVRYADGYLNKEKIGNVNSAGEIVVEKRW